MKDSPTCFPLEPGVIVPFLIQQDSPPHPHDCSLSSTSYHAAADQGCPRPLQFHRGLSCNSCK